MDRIIPPGIMENIINSKPKKAQQNNDTDVLSRVNILEKSVADLKKRVAALESGNSQESEDELNSEKENSSLI